MDLLAVQFEAELRNVTFQIGLNEITASFQFFLAIITSITCRKAALEPQPI